MPEGCTQPALARTCGTGDEHGHTLAHIVAGGKVEHLLLVYSTLAVVDDLADGGLIAEACLLHEP